MIKDRPGLFPRGSDTVAVVRSAPAGSATCWNSGWLILVGTPSPLHPIWQTSSYTSQGSSSTPPAFTPPPLTSCLPSASTLLWQSPFDWWGVYTRVILHSWKMHGMMPPLHSAAQHGVKLLQQRNQDVFFSTPPICSAALRGFLGAAAKMFQCIYY